MGDQKVGFGIGAAFILAMLIWLVFGSPIIAVIVFLCVAFLGVAR